MCRFKQDRDRLSYSTGVCATVAHIEIHITAGKVGWVGRIAVVVAGAGATTSVAVLTTAAAAAAADKVN
jgi:hypothetical protein